MRLEIYVGTKEEFDKAAAWLSSGPEELKNYYTKILEKAASEKAELIDLQGLPKQEKPSDDFQVKGAMERIITDFFKDNEYPKQVRIICDSEEAATSYRVVYNFWFASVKTARMADEHWD